MKKKIIHNSKRCPDCNHTVRWARSDNLWKCLRCPSEFTDAELKSKKPYSEEPDYIETSPVLQMFNKPASQVMAPVIPVAPVALVAVAPIEERNDAVVVEEVYPSSHPEGEAFDVDELFRYHPKAEVKTLPHRMAMPTLQVSAQRAEAPTFDTGRNTYSLRSER